MATTADYLWERLVAWGVKRVYGYPGDGIGGIIGALARTNGAIEFVQVRHEEMAAFRATGWPKTIRTRPASSARRRAACSTD